MNPNPLSYSSAAEMMKAPPEHFASAAFSHLRWTTAGEQRDERMRLFGRKLLRRLDAMDMPFYAAVGLIDLRTAQSRFVRQMDPWTPAESPFLDGTAIEFKHCVHEHLPARCWSLFAEIGFDVARLCQTRVMWGGFNASPRPGMWMLYDGACPSGWTVDRNTYGVRIGGKRDVGELEG